MECIHAKSLVFLHGMHACTSALRGVHTCTPKGFVHEVYPCIPYRFHGWGACMHIPQILCVWYMHSHPIGFCVLFMHAQPTGVCLVGVCMQAPIGFVLLNIFLNLNSILDFIQYHWVHCLYGCYPDDICICGLSQEETERTEIVEARVWRVYDMFVLYH